MAADPAPGARFDQVNIVVADMERAVAFFRLLGAQLTPAPPPWDAHHQTLGTVSVETTAEVDSVASVVNWAASWPPGTAGVVVGFSVQRDEDVDEAVRAVQAAGHRVLQPAHDAFFGARYAVVESPDGLAVGVMGPVHADRQRMPELPGRPTAGGDRPTDIG